MSFTESSLNVDTDVLVELFLKYLNDRGLINNKTYLGALQSLKKGEDVVVDQK